MCLTSGLLVTTSGTYEKVGFDKAASMPAVAMQGFYGEFLGGAFMTIIIILFVLSTLIVMVYIGEKQIEYLFGTKISRVSRFVYIAMVLIGAFGSLGIIVSFLDISLASLVIINMFGVLTMTGVAVEESDRFFEYLKNEK
jgi:sodium:alanine symporter family protein